MTPDPPPPDGDGAPTPLLRSRGRLPRSGPGGAPRHVGDLWLDPAEWRAWRGPTDLHLTRTEFALLWALAATPGAPCSRPHITRHVWGSPHTDNTNLVDVCIRRLRRKLEPDPAHPVYIRTVRHVGYLLSGE